jgi:hypothetical protein
MSSPKKVRFFLPDTRNENVKGKVNVVIKKNLKKWSADLVNFLFFSASFPYTVGPVLAKDDVHA